MRLNLRSVRPEAAFNSFLGLLDIKLGMSRPTLSRRPADPTIGAEIILLFGVSEGSLA